MTFHGTSNARCSKNVAGVDAFASSLVIWASFATCPI